MNFLLLFVALITVFYFLINAIGLRSLGAPWKAWMLYLRGMVSAVFGYGILFLMSQETDSITASNLSPLLWIAAVVVMALFLSFTGEDMGEARLRARC
jgi:hypothetical protein